MTGKPSKHRLTASMNELSWIRKTIQRRTDVANKNSKVPAKLKALFNKLNDKLTDEPEVTPTGQYIINSNRNELRILQEVAKNEHAAIVTTVIPAYQERSLKDPERYNAYVDRALAQADTLATILNKIERLL